MEKSKVMYGEMNERGRDLCLILGLLMEEERSHQTGNVYYGYVKLKGGGLSYFNEHGRTALHELRSEDYLYLRAEDPKLKGTYIPVKRDLIKELIDKAIQSGEASTSFDAGLTVDTRQTAEEDRIIEHQAYEQDHEQYRGKVDLYLKVPPKFVHELILTERALWSTIQIPNLEFIVDAKGDTQWIK